MLGPDEWYATPITTDGSDYTLTEVTAQIEDFNPAGTLFMEVWLVDSGNFNPSAPLARLSLVDANFPKVFTGNVSLAANTSYFIVSGVDNGGGHWKEDINYGDPFGPYFSVQSGSWSLSTIGVAVPQSLRSVDFGATWTDGGALSAPLRMSISATAVPEPSTWALLGLAALARVRCLRRREVFACRQTARKA
ncbi:MAG: choice-of-anchor R domain-containing protein [Terrimicrobiaceae bacterium]